MLAQTAVSPIRSADGRTFGLKKSIKNVPGQRDLTYGASNQVPPHFGTDIRWPAIVRRKGVSSLNDGSLSVCPYVRKELTRNKLGSPSLWSSLLLGIFNDDSAG